MDRKKLAILAFSVFFKKRKKKRCWHKSWLGDYQRILNSFTFNLEPFIFGSGAEDVRHYIRLPPEIFHMILAKIAPFVTKKSSNARLSISPREKLSLTLSFLAEGLSLQRLGYEYRVGMSTVFHILNDTITALNKVLAPDYLRAPGSVDEWVNIANEFEKQWNFPHCIGALDGKHILMFPPRNSGSLFYNYKEGFSIVLLALVDANYKFISVDIGANGRCSDSGIWGRSELRKLIFNNKANLPDSKNLPGCDTSSPFVILGDSGFPLEPFLMRPYPEQNITPKERIFNYRLSRARRVSENAFGILANRWRILLQRMLLSPEKATAIVTACCCLHNLLCSYKESRLLYAPEDYVDKEDTLTGQITPGLWRKSSLPSLPSRKTTRYSTDAKIVREKLKHYFSEEGKVYWQDTSAYLT